MIFKQLNPGACRTYLIASERTREAALIDPVLQGTENYLRLLRQEELKVKWVIDTHTHADHLSGGAALQRAVQVDYIMHSKSVVKCVSRRVKDGETLAFGEVTLKFVHVPGHTQDSLMLLLPDRFLSGDFLFIGQGGAGRLDLPGGDPAAHYKSLSKLDALSDETLMFPAHDYQGNAQSTLRDERSSNPVLQPRSREAYLEWWNGLRLGPADWMKKVLEANAVCTCEPDFVNIPSDHSACEACSTSEGPSSSRQVVEWTPQELAGQLAKTSLTVIDVREPDEYISDLGHIRNSRLIPLGQIVDRLAEIPKGPVVMICRSGRRSMRAAEQLLNAGWTEVYSLSGGMQAWNEAGLPTESDMPSAK